MFIDVEGILGDTQLSVKMSVHFFSFDLQKRLEVSVVRAMFVVAESVVVFTCYNQGWK